MLAKLCLVFEIYAAYDGARRSLEFAAHCSASAVLVAAPSSFAVLVILCCLNGTYYGNGLSQGN